MKERVLSLIVKFLGSTSRSRIRGLEPYQEHKSRGQGAVLCLWHGKMLFPLYFFRNRGIRPIISRHRDGELLARVSHFLGYRPIRGSSSRFGGAALTQAIRALKMGEDVVFAADGPRGPLHRLKPGCLWAASRSGAPIFLGSYASRPAKKLRSWDRFNLFPPFSRVVMEIKGPIFVPPDADLEEWRKKIEGELREMDRRLEAEVSGKIR